MTRACLTAKAGCLQVEGTISNRLSARWAAKQGNSATAIARVEQQAARKAQQLTRVTQPFNSLISSMTQYQRAYKDALSRTNTMVFSGY